MQKRVALVFLLVIAVSARAGAEPDYYRLELTIDIDRSAEHVWSRVGSYCAIGDWLGMDCEITSGDGGIGTVRVLNGRIVEPMVAQTELSYGYTQPVIEGQYYTLYHGFMEAKPTGPASSTVIYTMMWDRSASDDAQFAADVERRRNLFTGGLRKIKEIAERD